MELLFGSQISEFRGMLKTLQESVDTVLTVLDKLKERVDAIEKTLAVTDKKFEACASGFCQTRDACTCLREELSEARGTIIDATYNTYDCGR